MYVFIMKKIIRAFREEMGKEMVLQTSRERRSQPSMKYWPISSGMYILRRYVTYLQCDVKEFTQTVCASWYIHVSSSINSMYARIFVQY